jgi:hypothetical protein
VLHAALPCVLQGEISSLSCEPHSGSELVVSLFEVPYSAGSVAAFIAREHEFRFLAVQPYDLTGQMPTERLAVSCNSLAAAAGSRCVSVHATRWRRLLRCDCNAYTQQS